MKEGKYTVTLDRYNYIVYIRTKVTKGKYKGEIKDEVHGYYSTLQQAIRSISDDMLRRKLKNNKVKTLEGIAATIDKHVKTIEEKFGS